MFVIHTGVEIQGEGNFHSIHRTSIVETCIVQLSKSNPHIWAVRVAKVNGKARWHELHKLTLNFRLPCMAASGAAKK